MTDPVERMTEMLGLIAEQKINAATTANLIVLTEIVQILIDKDLLSREELDRKLAKVDLAASLHKVAAPDIASYVAMMTLQLRNAFQLDAGDKSKSN